MDVFSWLVVLLATGWPLFMVGAMLLTGDLELPERLREWLEDRRWAADERRRLAAERIPASPEHTTGTMVFEEGLAAGPLEGAVSGGRWWRWRPTAPPLLVTEQDDFLFEPHWCVYELAGLVPRLVAALPTSSARTIQDLVGEAVQPRHSWEPRLGATEYPWKPVPAYVDRSLGATAAWVGRQQIGAWL